MIVYTVATLTLVTLVAAAMRALGVAITTPAGAAFILVGMWVPSVARLVATRSTDRSWRSVLPIRRWGRPRAWVVLGPLFVVVGIYSAAYTIALVTGVERAAPVWHGARDIVLNIALNLPLLALLGLIGAIGEELGWRGYLQPRLDQLGVRGSLLIVVVIEVLYHLPFILLGGYLASESMATMIGLACLAKLAGTALWTYGTNRLQSIWVAFWFHTLHNAFSQTIFPKVFGAGAPHVLGEMGYLPVSCALVVAAALVLMARLRHRPFLPLPWLAPV